MASEDEEENAVDDIERPSSVAEDTRSDLPADDAERPSSELSANEVDEEDDAVVVLPADDTDVLCASAEDDEVPLVVPACAELDACSVPAEVVDVAVEEEDEDDVVVADCDAEEVVVVEDEDDVVVADCDAEVAADATDSELLDAAAAVVANARSCRLCLTLL